MKKMSSGGLEVSFSIVFMSSLDVVHSRVEEEKSFITLGQNFLFIMKIE